LYNRIAFQGNDLPVEIILNARKMPGTTLTLSVSEGGTTLHSEQLRVNGSNFSSTINFSLPAEEAGTHHYVVRLTSGQDEVTRENNRYDLFVDVLQSKQKILILSNAPHPDISAIKEAIKTNINYEVDDMILDEYAGQLEAYSLIILHQLPSFSPASSSLFSRLGRAKVPMLMILGEQSDLRFFNELKAGMQTTSVHRTGMTEVFPSLNESFTTFNISKELADLIPRLPPLNVPFNRYTAANSARILFTQKIGDIESPDPLWILQGATEVKTGVIAGTGLWRWKIKSWLITGKHRAFNELISKTVQFLAVKDDKRKFRVNSRQRFPENIPVSIEAELYNDTYEPFNEPDVNIEILDEEGNAYDYVFSRTRDAYTLNAGGLGVGRYTFRATTRYEDQVLSDQGGFVITPVVAEQTSLRAAHEMLEELAEMKNGRLLRMEELDSLPEILKQRGDVKPLLHAEKKYVEFIDIWWMLLIILALLGLEWFLRKWSGSY